MNVENLLPGDIVITRIGRAPVKRKYLSPNKTVWNVVLDTEARGSTRLPLGMVRELEVDGSVLSFWRNSTLQVLENRASKKRLCPIIDAKVPGNTGIAPGRLST